MGWVDDDGHEVFVSPVFADGLIGGSVSSRGVTTGRDADGKSLPHERWEFRGFDQVTGWVVACDCSRTRTVILARWTRVLDPTLEDAAGDRFYVPDNAVMDLDYRSDVEELMRGLWDAHRAPTRAMDAIREAFGKVRAAMGTLNVAVAAGRDAGLTWGDVGRATRMTRQSARERWGTSTNTDV